MNKNTLLEIYNGLSEEEKDAIVQEYEQYWIDKEQGKDVNFLMDIVDGKIKCVLNEEEKNAFMNKIFYSNNDDQKEEYLNDSFKISEDIADRLIPIDERKQNIISYNGGTHDFDNFGLHRLSYLYTIKTKNVDKKRNTIEKLVTYILEPLDNFKKSNDYVKRHNLLLEFDIVYNENILKLNICIFTPIIESHTDENRILGYVEKYNTKYNDLKIKIADFIQPIIE